MTPVTLNPVFHRFLWKEYRMFRGFWLAVLLLGVAFQLQLNWLVRPGVDAAGGLLVSALATTALYAVGVASTIFAVEHEEGTYSLLSGLPLTWRPLFLGKAFFAAASALALAVALSITGWFLAEGRWPAPGDASGILGLFGVLILEGLAWGTLFSMLLKRPLVAAVVTLIVGATAIHLAVNAASTELVASLSLRAYSLAIPLRLATIGCVTLMSVFVARRWVVAAPRPRFRAKFDWPQALERSLTAESVEPKYSRHGMFARLLWQTWRQSWKSLPLPILVTIFLFFGTALLTFAVAKADELSQTITVGAMAFFLAALHGALVFHADQRRRRYRFLAEHAASPRAAWLARHAVWLGTLVVLMAAVTIALTVVVSRQAMLQAEQFLRHEGWRLYGQDQFLVDLKRLPETLMFGATIVWAGALLAYALGQVCSMLLRSEILASFLALVLSVVVAAWAALLFAWGLSAWLFLFPLFVGLMAATWLRIPNWICDRHAWRSWWPSALAIGVSLLAVGLLLPTARLNQVPDVSPRIAALVEEYEKGDTSAARETAAMYLRAMELSEAPLEDSPLEPWDKPEFMSGDSLNGLGGIDRAKIPPTEIPAFQAALHLFNQLVADAQDAPLALAIEASKRPTCRFDFTFDSVPLRVYVYRHRISAVDWVGVDPRYRGLMDFVERLALPASEPQETLDRLLAALRMSVHLRAGQPTAVHIQQLGVERDLLQKIGQWAARDDVTDDQLRDALNRLIEQYKPVPVDIKEVIEAATEGLVTNWNDVLARNLPKEAIDAFVADQLLMRQVILGKSEPIVFSEEDPDSRALALFSYLLNEIPWERERALRALDLMTLNNVLATHDVMNQLARPIDDKRGRPVQMQHLLPPYYYNSVGEVWWPYSSPAATSYFLAMEYAARVSPEGFLHQLAKTETCRRALVLQLALALYRHEHQAYPTTLDELVPKYLPRLPIDPYTGITFRYERTGLNRPLDLIRHLEHPLETGTPFLWSPGPDDAHFEERIVEVDRGDANGKPITDSKTVYQWENNRYGIGENDLVFPLAK
jgi:hypothetical protein